MIDAHCHLQFHSFENDFDEVAKRAFEAGVTRIINTGTKIDSSYKAVDFANAYPEMYAIIGVHPHHADKLNQITEDGRQKTEDRGRKTEDRRQRTETALHVTEYRNETRDWIEELEELGKHPKVIGIGEIGLDYFSYKSNGIVDPDIQKDIFEKQIELAFRLGLPLQIHNRQAGEDIVEILNYYKKSLQTVPGMFHCFAGSMEVLQGALDLGFFIGIDGNVTYRGLAPGETTDLKDIAEYVPFDRLIVETDSPFLAPIPHRGTRNEPKNVIVTAHYLADLKQITFEEMVEQTTKNVYTVFKKLK